MIGRRRVRSVAAACALLLALGVTACEGSAIDSAESPPASSTGATPAAESVQGISTDSSEAESIMAALRAPVEAELGQTVRFDTGWINRWQDYAVLQGVVLDSEGNEIDYAKVPKYASAVASGAFDPQFHALLQNTGGRWSVVRWEVGSTDAPSVAWSREIALPDGMWDMQRY